MLNSLAKAQKMLSDTKKVIENMSEVTARLCEERRKQEKKINTPKNQLLRDQYKMKNSACQEALKEIGCY